MANNKTITGVVGQIVNSAESSLNSLAIVLDDGQAILITAIADAGEAIAQVSVVEKSQAPRLNEAVCRVDWSWLGASKIVDILADDNKVRLQLSPAGPLTITAAIWQGKPFLGFQPYKAAK